MAKTTKKQKAPVKAKKSAMKLTSATIHTPITIGGKEHPATLNYDVTGIDESKLVPELNKRVALIKKHWKKVDAYTTDVAAAQGQMDGTNPVGDFDQIAARIEEFETQNPDMSEGITKDIQAYRNK